MRQLAKVGLLAIGDAVVTLGRTRPAGYPRTSKAVRMPLA